MQMAPSIAFVIVWFGAWPFWMSAFLLSCRRNPSVEWLIFTDQTAPGDAPENVKFIPLKLAEFNRRLADTLGPDVELRSSFIYKLCDFKITYGRIFEAELKPYDFWGCCDMDVLWGSIRSFLTPERLAQYDVVSARPNRVSGHCLLFRNRPEWNDLFRRIPDVQARLEDGGVYRHVDEDGLSKVLQWYQHSAIGRFVACRIRRLPLPRVWWEEVWTTSGKHQRLMLDDATRCMRWRDGRTYGVDGQEMMYLHFHSIRREMRGTDVGPGDSPHEICVSPAGIYVSNPGRDRLASDDSLAEQKISGALKGKLV